ncbi:hypothetical protein V496_02115 [Pseudogymnoascus sp. VKM F-4515 (FW-2607)]|nr:hypothetical protein V496_02115 [Pseudogymnoascus sp. VKM F-4515 (FW-2607)]
MSSIVVSWTPGHKYSTSQDGSVEEITINDIETIVPGKDENYTLEKMEAGKDHPWFKLQLMSTASAGTQYLVLIPITATIACSANDLVDAWHAPTGPRAQRRPTGPQD